MLFSLSKSQIKYQRRKNDIYNDVFGITVAGTLATLPSMETQQQLAIATAAAAAASQLY
jgi:hypothetical protein